MNALATLFDRRTKYSQVMYDEIGTFFRNQMLTTIIRLSVDLKKAAARGVSVMRFNRESIGSYDYMALGQEILRADGAAEFEQAMQSVQEESATPAEVINAPRHTTESGAPVVREVTFNISAPAAKDIFLVGDFNHWKMNEESRLSRLEDGRWEKRLSLASGRYKYKFIVDGEWVLDSQNSEREQNSFGTFDSIISLQG